MYLRPASWNMCICDWTLKSTESCPTRCIFPPPFPLSVESLLRLFESGELIEAKANGRVWCQSCGLITSAQAA